MFDKRIKDDNTNPTGLEKDAAKIARENYEKWEKNFADAGKVLEKAQAEFDFVVTRE
jgi:hypothetical protein